MMPKKVTQSESRILQMLYALIDKRLNCIVSCRYTFSKIVQQVKGTETRPDTRLPQSRVGGQGHN